MIARSVLLQGVTCSTARGGCAPMFLRLSRRVPALSPSPIVLQSISRHPIRTTSTNAAAQAPAANRNRCERREIMLFDTLKGGKVPLGAAEDGRVTWYMCGPTVYDDSHIGHARTFVSFDIVRRVMERRFGLRVHQVCGVTDVDDKIIARAAERGLSPTVLARKYEEAFWEDLAALGVKRPSAATRVSEHIAEIITFIEGIITHGFAYVAASGSVYFDTVAFGPAYGRFRPLAAAAAVAADVQGGAETLEPDEGAEGDGVRGEKRCAADFALWKATRAGEEGAVWDSPWGAGRPGWHIECSAMASAHFEGPNLDIHSGGVDLQFPHHENELAQCEAHHHGRGGGGWARFWLHAGHLHIHGRKMSKSLKNFISIRQFLGTHEHAERAGGPGALGTAEQFRIFCLLNHYRTGTTYSQARIDEAERILQRFASLKVEAKLLSEGGGGGDVAAKWGAAERAMEVELRGFDASVEAALADDFDTRSALLAAYGLAGRALQYASSLDRPSAGLVVSVDAAVASLLADFGLGEGNVRGEGARTSTAEGDGQVGAEWVDRLVKLRGDVRGVATNKPLWEAVGGNKWKPIRGKLLELCDDVRDDAASMGVEVKDRSDGSSVWQRKGSGSEGGADK